MAKAAPKRKTSAKKTASKSAPAEAPVKKSAASKPAAKKAAPKKAATKKTSSPKAVTAKVAAKKTVAKKAAPKKAAATSRPAVKKTASKATAKRPVGRPPGKKKDTAKAVAKRPVGRPPGRKAAAKTVAKPVATKRPVGRPPGRKNAPKAKAVPARRLVSKAPPQVFTVSHLNEADFKADGLRAYAQYRDLGIAAATSGLCQAHVIRMISPCTDEVRQRHLHETELQLIYVLKGWIKNEFEGHGEQMMSAGTCWLQPPGIEHTVLDYSADVELLEIIVPADFKTTEV